MKRTRPLLLLLSLVIGARLLTGCGSDQPTPYTPGAPLQGRVVLEFTMPVDPAYRAQMIQNRAAIEGMGHIVAPDGSSVTWPSVPAAGWIVRLGQGQAITDTTGSFTIPAASGTGRFFHPEQPDTPQGSFTAARLVPAGSTPTPIILHFPWGGPCGMSDASQPSVCSGLSRNVHRPVQPIPPTRVGQHGWFYPSGHEDACGQLDGILQNVSSAPNFLKYFGSTCDLRVFEGCCPNEQSPGNAILSSFGLKTLVSCYDNHKGRFCQEVTPGDFGFFVPAGLANSAKLTIVQPVSPGAQILVTVHNNTCFGKSYVNKTQNQIGGSMYGHNLSGDLLFHYDGQKLAAWEAHPNSVDPGIYQADQDLRYYVPAAAPAGDDVYTFESEGMTLTLIFRLTPSSGQTTAGQTTAGQTTAGQTTAGQTTAGQTTAGQTSSGSTTTTGTTLTATLQLNVTLTANGTTFPAGSRIALTRIRGYFIDDPGPGCPNMHIHALPGPGIYIDGCGPFADPAPDNCGFGPLVQAP